MSNKGKKSVVLSLLLVICLVLQLFMPINAKALDTAESNVKRYTVLTLDVSGSMYGTPMTNMKKAAIKFCKSVLAASGENYVSIVKFESSASKCCEFTNDSSTLESTINSLYDGGGTNMNSALELSKSTLDSIESQSGTIKNIVLFSDGLPQSGSYKNEGKYTYSYYGEYANAAYETAKGIHDSNINVYTLGFFSALSTADRDFATTFMNDLQNKGYYDVENVEDLEFVFGEVADDITKPETEKEDKDPIIIIPGIMGSRLFSSSDEDFRQSNVVWDPEHSLTGIKGLDDKLQGTLYIRPCENQVPLEKYELTDEGLDTYKGKREYGSLGTYKYVVDGLCRKFPDREVYFFSYDWRKSNKENADNLKKIIDKIGSNKVDLVCHSMGGLVASSYFSQYESDNKIDKIVTCGTPYEGAPALINKVQNWDILENGTAWNLSDNLLGLVGGLTKKVKSRITSIAELTPTENYVLEIPMHKDIFLGTDKELSLEQYKEVCKKIFGENNYNNALEFQQSIIKDGYNKLLNYENSYFLVGINQKTISSIRFKLYGNDINEILYEDDIDYDTKGDGTVPYLSASIMRKLESKDEKYYKKYATDHGGTIGHQKNEQSKKVKDEATKSLEAIKDILATGETSQSSSTLDSSKHIVVRIACPVDVKADLNGETLNSSASQLNTTTSFGRLDILGKDDEIKMLCIDNSDDYKITLNGTDTGTMDYTIRYFNEDDTLNDERTIKNVPITKDTIITTGTVSSEETVLNVDKDGDGVVDKEYVIKQNEVIEAKDETAPTVIVTLKKNVIDKKNKDKIDYTVSIEAKDDFSGVDKVYYHTSNKKLSSKKVKDFDDWKTYKNSFKLNKIKYVYIKVVDKAGNIAYIEFDGKDQTIIK